jgi:ATP-dependent DNA helicase RecG
VTPDDLDTLREGWDFEAKLAAGRDGQGAVPESLWETYSAMANTEGGVIALGAKERPDGSLDLHGIADIDKVERDLWNLLQNPQKVSANLLRRDDVRRVELEGRALLVIQVPKAPRSQRPVHLNGSWETRTYLRVHEGDRVAEREVARRMLADAQPDHDAQVLDGYAEVDLDAESVRQYRQLLASKRPDHPFLREDDAGFLRQIGALGRDRLRNIDGITLGGLMMLGREDAIRDRFPHWHLSYRELPADAAAGPRWLDRIAPDGTWNANVFEFYSRVILKLHQGLKVPFALDADLFRNDTSSPHAALREALVNTLIHADYEGRAGVRVLRDPSGYEFINPGLLLVTPEQVWRGGVSESRNPVLQRLFGLLQLGEREGSGGPAIRQAWAQQHWSAPNLWEEVELSETHLKLRQVSLLPQESVDAVRAWLGAAFDALDELGRLALVTAHAERGFNHARLRDLTSAHPRDITRKLQELVRKGFLVTLGNTRAATYRLAAGSERSSGGSAQFPDGPESSEQSSLSSEQSLPGSEQSSEQSPSGSEQSSERRLPGSEQSSDPRGWAAKDKQLEAVLAFCADDWRTLPDIAVALGRTESTVRTKYLRPLLQQDALERRHPESPRHPHQAYRTAKSQT